MTDVNRWDALAEEKIRPLLIKRGLPESAANETATEVVALVMNWLQDTLELG